MSYVNDKVIRDLESIDYLYINPIRRINTQVICRLRLAQVVYKLMFYLTIVNKMLLHCHSWLHDSSEVRCLASVHMFPNSTGAELSS